MSKEIKYFCNLCKEKNEPSELLCVYWDCTKMIEGEDRKFGAYVVLTDVTKSDKHICKSCFKMIAEFIKEHKFDV